jgi:hypothetical protein
MYNKTKIMHKRDFYKVLSGASDAVSNNFAKKSISPIVLNSGDDIVFWLILANLAYSATRLHFFSIYYMKDI